MDVDGSAERRGPTCGCGCPFARTDKRRRTHTARRDRQRARDGEQIYGPGKEEGDRRVPVADPGRTAKEETVEEPGAAEKEERETQRELVML